MVPPRHWFGVSRGRLRLVPMGGAVTLRAVRAIPSATNLTWGVDTLSTVTKQSAIALVAKGCAFRGGYLFDVTPEEIADQVSVGLAFVPIARAMYLNGPACVSRLAQLGIPPGVTIWCDVEGEGLEIADVTTRVNAWASAIQKAGFEAGMYVGAGCPLTSSQLTGLAVTRYWHSCSRALEPSRGYCMRQLRPDDVYVAGIKVDVDIVELDYNGDLPTFAAA